MPEGDPLARFDSFMIDDRHRELSRRAFTWSIEHTVDPRPGRHAKETFLASTFALLCAPPSVTLEENLYSVMFLLFVFRAEDAPPTAMDEFLRRMDAAGDLSIATAGGELSTCYDALIDDLRRLHGAPTGFQTALRDMCVSIQLEQRAEKGTMSEEELGRLRRDSVGVPAYTECWRAIRGVSFMPELHEALQRSAILDIASEIAYLANDIGSLDKDEGVAQQDAQRVDLNIVRTRMRTLGDREAALRAVIELHNQRIADFQRAESSLLAAEHGADPTLHAYLDILRCTVNGNLATTKHLVALRYKGAAEPLARLHSL